MAYKSSSAVFGIKKEAVFNDPNTTFTADDVYPVTSDSNLKPEIDTIERGVIQNSYVKAPALAGKESGSGSIQFEAIPEVITPNPILESVFGVYATDKAVIRSSSINQVEYTITADDNNSGDGQIDKFYWNENRIQVETWTIENIGNDEWSVTGSVSGAQPNAKTGVFYDNGIIEFMIVEGSTAFAEGDKFTIDVTAVNVSDMIYEAQGTEVGRADLYKLSKPCSDDPSFAVRVDYGCSTEDSRTLIMRGCVPNSVQFEIPVGDIIKITADIAGSSFETKEGEEPLLSKISEQVPYLGKNMIFSVAGKTYEAKDVSFTIENSLYDREAITSSGITGRIPTAKSVKGSFTITFEDWGELNTFKQNGTASLFVEGYSTTPLPPELVGQQNTNKFKLAFYFPYISYTSVSVEDDNGVLVNKIEFEAYEDPELKESVYFAQEPNFAE